MRILLCVTSDITTDQRVNRIALSLKKLPADVGIIGTQLPKSLPLPSNGLFFHRIQMLFLKGPFFYAEYNLRLFFYLLFHHADIIVSNDLDTLTASFLASRFKRIPLVYDSHEYFTELPELIHRKFTRGIWNMLEKMILPHISYAYTVSPSIAKEYQKKYGIQMAVIRNLPFRRQISGSTTIRKKKEFRILYQGSLNVGRGLELAISAMQHVSDAKLYIAGSGYLEEKLKALSRHLKLEGKVVFLGRMRPERLYKYTSAADLGISLEENRGLNYYYALPNKLFDYIQAGIPVLVSNMPEMAAIVSHYKIGSVIETDDCKVLALHFAKMLTDDAQRQIWKENIKIAAQILCWENEEEQLLVLYRKVIDDTLLPG